MRSLIFYLGFPCLAFASYYDQIDLAIEEVWKAASQVLEGYGGIRKADLGKRDLESHWTEDTVVQSRGLLKGIFKQRYHRRYRILIHLEDLNDATHVQIRGIFEEKSAATNPSIPWKHVKATASDHSVEREVFFKILTELEKNKKTASSTLSSSLP